MNTLLAACVQFVAGPDKSENIERMAPLVARAAARGAKLVLLPEKWNAVADGPELARYAERLDGGETVDALAGWAREHRIDLICGSIAIEGAGNGPGVGNVSIAFAPDGAVAAAYTKIHLFDVDVGGITYRESDGTAPGADPVVAELAGLPVGLTVCYDLRFPELYRELTDRGRAGAERARELHAAHRHGALGAAAPRAGDREPVLRAGRRTARIPGRRAQAVVRAQHDHRPLGRGAGRGSRRRRRDRRRARSGRPAEPSASGFPPSVTGRFADQPDPIFNSREDPPNG